MRTCTVCQATFENPSKRGRPALRCNACRLANLKPLELTTLRSSISTKERIDRLELALKANQSHISQHRTDND